MLRAQQEQLQELPGTKGQPGWMKEPTSLPGDLPWGGLKILVQL